MKERPDKIDFNPTNEESIDTRFSEFQKVVAEFGLSTFVDFVMHKNFDHTDTRSLTDSDKEVLIAECQPLLLEAISKEQPLQ